jgi:hypothetical protein
MQAKLNFSSLIYFFNLFIFSFRKQPINCATNITGDFKYGIEIFKPVERSDYQGTGNDFTENQTRPRTENGREEVLI